MRFLLLIPALLLAACGFHPQHSREYQASLNVDLSAVRIEVYQNRFDKPMEDRSHLGQLLTTEIREGVSPRLNATEKLYLMRISVNEMDIPLFINPDGTSSRGNIQYDSSYTLTRLVDGKPLQTGEISRTSSYNTSQNADYASYVSQEDAKTRGILELAQAYKLRLSNLLPLLNGKVAAPAPMQEALPQPQPPTPADSSKLFGGPNETRPSGY